MKVLISFGVADRPVIDELGTALTRAGIEVEQDLTLMEGTAVAVELKRRSKQFDGWIVALGRQEGGSGWIDREIVELLRLGDVIVVPLYLAGYDENPVFSALADRVGLSVADARVDRAAEIIAEMFSRGGARPRVQPLATRLRQADEVDWASAEDLAHDERRKLIHLLPELFPRASLAMPLLRRIGVPSARIPAFANAETFWEGVATELERGAAEDRPPFLRLLQAASRIYLANPVLHSMAARHGLLVVDDGRTDEVVKVLVGVDSVEHGEETQCGAEEALRTLGLEPVEQWSTSNAVLYQVNAADADDVTARIAGEARLETAMVLAAGDAAHLMHQLLVEGPDGRRFQLTDVPAAQRGSDLLATLRAHVPYVAGGPHPIVLDRVDPGGERTRMNPEQTLADAGVQDGDSLRVGYEAIAGCFPAEALVLLADESRRPIGELRGGDLVVTSSQYRDRTVEAAILGVARYERARCMTINHRLTLTPSHALLVNNGWKPAAELRLGDALVGVDGVPIVVTALETIGQDQPVYVPVLPPNHDGFFVDDVFVRNMVDVETYDAFRRSGFDPRSAASVLERLAQTKQEALQSWPVPASSRQAIPESA